MLTDVRDVFFLGNPFDFEIGSSLHVFLEDETRTIATHIPSRAWLLGAYGQETFDELSDRPIVCAGTTIGAAPAMLEYLGIMVDHLAELKRQFDGMDQGIHNYILHKGRVPNVEMQGNEEGPVLTVAMLDGGAVRRLVFERPSRRRSCTSTTGIRRCGTSSSAGSHVRTDGASPANQGV